MTLSKIAGIGMYVPPTVVSNDDLAKIMNTSDEWIRERTGIIERRYATRFEENTTTMGVKAAEMAIRSAGITAQDIDFVIFATLSPDYYFPGCGVLVQRSMNMKEVGALDIRNQCSGFIYGLSIADQFVKTGMYKNVLVVCSETHSHGLDFSNNGRNVTVIFGDGAGAIVLQPSSNEKQGVLSTHLHSDGAGAEVLGMLNPGFHGGIFVPERKPQQPDQPYGGMFITPDRIATHDFYPQMDGPVVFKKAIEKFPEVIHEALNATGHTASDIDMFIPHQANLRISQMVQHKLGLPDDKVFNNIQRYGNTTAATIPIALYEALQQGKIKEGDLVCIAAFGSGFTWGSALIKW